MVYMYHSFLIHSSADGQLGCFHVLAMINSAAMNIGVHMSLSDLVSLVCMPRSGIAKGPSQLSLHHLLHMDQVEELILALRVSVRPYPRGVGVVMVLVLTQSIFSCCDLVLRTVLLWVASFSISLLFSYISADIQVVVSSQSLCL